MERFLRENPGIRWSLFLVLIAGILLEWVLITNRASVIASLTPPAIGTSVPGTGGGDVPPGSTPQAVTLACRVVASGGANFRRVPSIENDADIITLLPVDTTFTATARTGDVPWLQIQIGNDVGWVSTKLATGTALVECDQNFQALPEVGSASTSDTADQAPNEPTQAPADNVRLREGNGPDLHAARRTGDIALDGVLTEWNNTSAAPVNNAVFQPENWSGPQDSNGLVRAMWDDGYLYLAAQVADDVAVQEGALDQLYKGDSIEIFLDTQLEQDFGIAPMDADDAQIVISPGNFAGRNAEHYVYSPNTPSLVAAITYAFVRTDIGYDVEIRIPWNEIGAVPAARTVFGYAFALDDDDTPGTAEQESQVATNLVTPFNDPRSWGNLILDP